MKENKKWHPGQAFDRPTNKDEPDKRYPDPDDPNEEEAMPNKEMPDTNNPHNEEITD